MNRFLLIETSKRFSAIHAERSKKILAKNPRKRDQSFLLSVTILSLLTEHKGNELAEITWIKITEKQTI